MKLCYTPGACSLADMALAEAGLAYETRAFASPDKNLKPFFAHDASSADHARAGAIVTKRLDDLARDLSDDGFAMGGHFTVADAHLVVTLMWARKFGVAVPAALEQYFDRLGQGDAVAGALATETAPRSHNRKHFPDLLKASSG